MTFDLSTAKPYGQAGGFDLSTAKPAPPPAEDSGQSLMSSIGQGLGNLGAGALRGAGSIGATLLWPIDKATDMIQGDREQSLSGLVTGKKPMSRNEERRHAMDSGLQLMGADPESMLYKGGKLGAEVAGTLGVGGMAANGVRALSSAPAAEALASAIASGGFKTGQAAAPGMLSAAANMATRTAGGAINGGLSAGLVNPEDAGMGALIGGALPMAAKAANAVGGKVGSAAKTLLAGPRASEELQKQIAAAREAGYVIPPTQAKASLGNRTLEGFAGKLTTAQNASARNQPVTNKLAAAAVGADDLTEASLGAVRQRAGEAYDKIKQVGQFVADEPFQEALAKAGGASAKMKENFPKLVNSEIEGLVESLAGRPQFDSETAIEAIKKFRFDGSANKISLDPAKKALGNAQMNISNALEDLIDRNLQQAGAPELLTDYRAARTTFAKLYDIEKALNKASGNIDATKIGKLLTKGRPLTDELRTIGEFANTFPKAAKSVEGMGSLPQSSPLDWATMGTLSAVTSNPLMMAGVLARPAARAAALSGPVQNRLMPGTPGYLEMLLQNQRAQQLMYQAAPVIGSQ